MVASIASWMRWWIRLRTKSAPHRHRRKHHSHHRHRDYHHRFHSNEIAVVVGHRKRRLNLEVSLLPEMITIKDSLIDEFTGKGNGKLWEFIRDLLLNPLTNPSLIRWERREDGIFKFIQSDKVAKMWGERKQNPRMTYEKLSRAMRLVSNLNCCRILKTCPLPLFQILL